MKVWQVGALAWSVIMTCHRSQSIDFKFGNQLNLIQISSAVNPSNFSSVLKGSPNSLTSRRIWYRHFARFGLRARRNNCFHELTSKTRQNSRNNCLVATSLILLDVSLKEASVFAICLNLATRNGGLVSPSSSHTREINSEGRASSGMLMNEK